MVGIPSPSLLRLHRLRTTWPAYATDTSSRSSLSALTSNWLPKAFDRIVGLVVPVQPVQKRFSRVTGWRRNQGGHGTRDRQLVGRIQKRNERNDSVVCRGAGRNDRSRTELRPPVRRRSWSRTSGYSSPLQSADRTPADWCSNRTTHAGSYRQFLRCPDVDTRKRVRRDKGGAQTGSREIQIPPGRSQPQRPASPPPAIATVGECAGFGWVVSGCIEAGIKPNASGFLFLEWRPSRNGQSDAFREHVITVSTQSFPAGGDRW